jgi:aminoethylphosphonate catabolism LysR family transcriptional regulator
MRGFVLAGMVGSVHDSSFMETSCFPVNISAMPMTHGAELRAFHAAARQGSISAGARQLGLSQPTVSGHIAQLEEQYGVELFYRRGRRVELTDFGQRLLEVTRRLADAEVEALSLLMEARRTGVGQLRLCAVGPYNALPLVRAFREMHPNVRIAMRMGDSQQILHDVLDYEGDVGILVHAVADPRLLCVPYRRQPLVFFARADHPLARRPKLALSDLEGQAFVMREQGSTTRRVLERVLEEEGVRVACNVEIGSREAVREAVAQGLGIGIVAETAYVEDARTVRLPLRCDRLHTHVHVVCLRERRETRVVAPFLELVGRLAQAGS